MKLSTSKVLGALALGVLGAPAIVGAQPGGPYAPLVLLMPSSARMLGMGNAGVAGRDDDVLFYNPAQLMVARGTSGSYERYSGTSGGGTLSSVTRLSNSAFALGVELVDYKAPFQGNSVFAGTAPGGTPLVQFPLDRGGSLLEGAGQGVSTLATFGYATTFKSVRIGAAAKYAEDEVPAASVRRGALDVGAARDFFRFYTLALSVQNIGKPAKLACVAFVEPHGPCQVSGSISQQFQSGYSVYMPLRTTLGGGYSHILGEFDFASTAAVSMIDAKTAYPSGGVELGYSWLDGYNIALRAGARRGLPGEGTITGGAGLTMDRLTIDYALETLAGSRIGHRIGFRIR